MDAVLQGIQLILHPGNVGLISRSGGQTSTLSWAITQAETSQAAAPM